MCHQTELRRYFSLSFTQVWCLSSECQCVPCVPTAFQIKHDKFTDTLKQVCNVFLLTLRIFCCRLSIPSGPLVKSRPTPSCPTPSTTSRLDSEPPRRMGTGMLRTSQPLRSACRHNDLMSVYVFIFWVGLYNINTMTCQKPLC